MNPCPCGFHGDKQADCNCSADRVTNYRRKVSGPLLDRFDLHINVERPSTDALKQAGPNEERSADVRARVVAARERQLERQDSANARLDAKPLERHCRMSDACWTLLERAADRFQLSPRAHQRVRRVSRTIADLAGDAEIQATHVAEALSLRCLDRRM